MPRSQKPTQGAIDSQIPKPHTSVIIRPRNTFRQFPPPGDQILEHHIRIILPLHPPHIPLTLHPIPANDILIPTGIVHELIRFVHALCPRCILDAAVERTGGVVDHRVAVGVDPAGVEDEPGLVYIGETEGVPTVLVAGLDEVGIDGLDAYGQGATGGGLDGC